MTVCPHRFRGPLSAWEGLHRAPHPAREGMPVARGPRRWESGAGAPRALPACRCRSRRRRRRAPPCGVEPAGARIALKWICRLEQERTSTRTEHYSTVTICRCGICCIVSTRKTDVFEEEETNQPRTRGSTMRTVTTEQNLKDKDKKEGRSGRYKGGRHLYSNIRYARTDPSVEDPPPQR